MPRLSQYHYWHSIPDAKTAEIRLTPNDDVRLSSGSVQRFSASHVYAVRQAEMIVCPLRFNVKVLLILSLFS